MYMRSNLIATATTCFQIIPNDTSYMPNHNLSKHFELARVNLQNEIGLNDDNLREKGFGFYVFEAYYLFYNQVSPNDSIEIRSKIEPDAGSRNRHLVAHKLYVANTLMAEAETLHTLVNLKTERPSLKYRNFLNPEMLGH